MTDREDRKPTRNLRARFEDIDAAVPLDDEEANRILATEGIDPAAALGRLISCVNETARESRRARFRHASAERSAKLLHLRDSSRPRSRQELLGALQRIRQQSPEAQAMYKNLESVTDEDLASLVEELEFLAAQDDEET